MGDHGKGITTKSCQPHAWSVSTCISHRFSACNFRGRPRGGVWHLRMRNHIDFTDDFGVALRLLIAIAPRCSLLSIIFGKKSWGTQRAGRSLRRSKSHAAEPAGDKALTHRILRSWLLRDQLCKLVTDWSSHRETKTLRTTPGDTARIFTTWEFLAKWPNACDSSGISTLWTASVFSLGAPGFVSVPYGNDRVIYWPYVGRSFRLATEKRNFLLTTDDEPGCC
jgi:hypothetical protein